MNTKRIIDILYDTFLEAGFHVRRPSDTEHLFTVESANWPSQKDLLPHVYVKGCRHGVLVSGRVNATALLGSNKTGFPDALEQVCGDLRGQGRHISIGIESEDVVIDIAVTHSLLTSNRRMYAQVYDAAIDISVAVGLICDELKFRRRLGGEG